ncbi:hypothetical protein EGR_08578 [Echinococcus granulosus]|uniref:Uncharacterized protein n=1 Tax=Echinococcus granulosus TaxID=6210 RepID=W6UEN3_ECHGR|nr:hypothetical protein EGR_08578 [Echinococcus granulosus]EUB56552.1 hypothetical protein EGR_08578 [Echinococcus granulosus]
MPKNVAKATYLVSIGANVLTLVLFPSYFSPADAKKGGITPACTRGPPSPQCGGDDMTRSTPPLSPPLDTATIIGVTKLESADALRSAKSICHFRDDGSHSLHCDSRRYGEDREREGEGKKKRDKTSTEAPASKSEGAVFKMAVPPLALTLLPPLPGFIYAKSCRTAEEEVKTTLQRTLAPKASGFTLPTVVLSIAED